MRHVLATLAILCLLAGGALAETGRASWYGPGFHGRKTASGEVFNQNGATCAAPSFRSGRTRPYSVRITNLSNGRSARCRVNDRMSNNGRILDVSRWIADQLDMRKAGTARVRIDRLN